jgi:Ser/Thr protein kinase RdoA (MazF antagonist)
MPKINSEKQIKISREILTKVLLNYDINEFDFEFPENGLNNVNVLIISDQEKYFLRVQRLHKKTDAELELELQYLAYLRNKNLPVPIVVKNKFGKNFSIFSDLGLNWQIILFQSLPGIHLPYSDFKNDFSLVKKISKLQSDLYLANQDFKPIKNLKPITNLAQTSTAKIIEELLIDFNVESIKNPKIKKIINSRFLYYKDIEQENLTFSLVHDDINQSNLLFENGEISGLLDFDEVYLGPVVSCVVNAAYEFIRFKKLPEYFFVYLHYFETGFSLKPQDIVLVKPLLQLRNILFIVYLTKTFGENFRYVNTHLSLAVKIDQI